MEQLLHELGLGSAGGRLPALSHVLLDARKHLDRARAVVRAQLQQRCGDAVLHVKAHPLVSCPSLIVPHPRGMSVDPWLLL